MDSDSDEYFNVSVSDSEYFEVVNSSQMYETESESHDDEEMEEEESPVSSEYEFEQVHLTPPLNPNGNLNLGLFNLRFSKFMWCSEYIEDIYCSLTEIEEKRTLILNQSPQLHFRPALINLIKNTGENLKLSKTTVHLAVYLLDVFMDTYEIIESKFNAVALTSIFIAAKIEERDSKVPRLEKLSKMSKIPYRPSDIKDIEVQILKCCKWYVLYPTAATFIESFLTRILTLNEARKFLLNPLTSYSSFNEVIITINKLVFDYLDLVLEDLELVSKKPSLVAAACVAAARKQIGIKPVWNDRLYKETYYAYPEMKSIVQVLMELMKNLTENKMFNGTPDSGALSDYSCSDSDDVAQEEILYECSVPYKRLRVS